MTSLLQRREPQIHLERETHPVSPIKLKQKVSVSGQETRTEKKVLSYTLKYVKSLYIKLKVIMYIQNVS